MIKDFFYADYYPITKWNRTDTDFRGWEFFDPGSGRGYFQLFRPEQCNESSIIVKLHGLIEYETYLLTDSKGEKVYEESGKYLMETGVKIDLGKRRSSAVFLIEKK